MVKQIIIDENNIVTCCSIGGYIEGGIDVEDIPDEVMACPSKWCYIDEKYTENPDYNSGVDINTAKAYKVEESKVKLAEWLNTHPILYTDEKYYSVTEEKQTLLNSNLASYERAEKLGMIYTLKWNAVGEKCVEWSYNNLTNLSLTIAAYVGERVSQQQVLETEIQACETFEELDKIVIHYV